MEHVARRWMRIAYWNLWAVVRLFLILAALGVWAHRSCGLQLPSVWTAAKVIGGLVILLAACSALSARLGRLYLVLLGYPLYAVIILNCVFYDGPRLMARQLLGRWPPALEAGFALVCEAGLFTGFARSVIGLLKAL